MKTKPCFRTMTSCVLTAALSTACATRTTYVDLYGDPAPASAGQRTIVIGPGTRYVNVEGGEIIRFVAGGKEFGWNFYVARGISNFRLNDVAPSGVLDHEVQAYISPDPRYIGGGDHCD
ncbi:MAG: hypothetical protein V7642_4889 [Burkholderiales bacterium]|jgi:hypothetical protein